MMIDQLLQAIMQQLQTPKADLEKNLRAVLSEMVERMELVSQAELQRQQLQLQQAQQDIKALLGQIDQLTQQMALLDHVAINSLSNISPSDASNNSNTDPTSQP